MEQLDPIAYNMMRAIRQAESGGNYTARSKDGSFGAFQFIKPTWDATARKYGVFAPWDKATKGEQNKVAYRQIKEWVDKGFNIGEIASMWNAGAGRPNAYKEGLKGTNSSGVNYNTTKYAEKVYNFYQQLKQGGDFTTNKTVAQVQPETPPQEGVGFVQSLVRGVVNPFLRPLVNARKLGEVLDNALKGENTTREQVAAPVNFGSYLGDVKPIGQEGTLGQKVKDAVGAGLELGAYGIGGAGLKAGAAAGGLIGLGNSLQGNKSLQDTALNTTIGAVTGGVGSKVIQKAAPFVSNLVNKAGNKIQETAWSSILKRIPTSVAKNPKLESQIAEKGVVGLTRSAISQKFGKEIQNIELGIAGMLKGNKMSVRTENVVGYLDELRKIYANIPGEQSSIKTIDSIIQNVLKKGKVIGVEAANELKRDIYGVVQKSYGKGLLEIPAKTEAQKIIAYGLKSEIEELVPEIKDINAQQAIFIQAKKAIDKTIARQTGKGIAGTGVGMLDLLTAIGGTVGGTAIGQPLAGVSLLGAKKLAESPAFLSTVSKGTQKLITLFNNSSPTQKALIYITLKGLISEKTK